MEIRDIVEKRKQRWAERKDIEYDRALTAAAAEKILSSPRLRSEVIERPYLLIEAVFTVVNKEKETVPFFLNEVQADFIKQLEKHGTGRPYFILKGRQQGFTTVVTAVQLAFAIVRKNFSGFTMADRSDNTNAIFNDKARVVFERLPDILKPSMKFNSKNEMFFDKLNSSWRIATATEQVGRSRTLNFAHLSEAAFYNVPLASIQMGLGEALTSNSYLIYETTANGFNEARELWQSGTCINLFYEWWRTPEYRTSETEHLETNDSHLKERIRILFEKGLDKEQVAWYAKKYKSYISVDAIKQEYPITPEEAFISSGSCVFDSEKLSNRIIECTSMRPVKVGEFEYKKVYEPIYDGGVKVGEEKKLTDIRFIERGDGCIRIHVEPEVKKDARGDIIGRAPYVIGGDTAGSGEDYFSAKAVNAMTRRSVATLHKKRMDEDEYAEQLICLGRYYHDALIGVEINYSREPMRIIASEYGYKNVYMRQKLDGLNDEVVLDAGFNTTSKTRPIIIAELVRLFRDDPSIESDIETLKEMSVFVKKANGRQEALAGQHDDLVMALAIAHFICGQQVSEWQDTGVGANGEGFILRNFEGTEYTSGFEAENGSFIEW